MPDPRECQPNVIVYRANVLRSRGKTREVAKPIELVVELMPKFRKIGGVKVLDVFENCSCHNLFKPVLVDGDRWRKKLMMRLNSSIGSSVRSS